MNSDYDVTEYWRLGSLICLLENFEAVKPYEVVSRDVCGILNALESQSVAYSGEGEGHCVLSNLGGSLYHALPFDFAF